eukprot:1677481-Rhodomonas_salina.3
MDEQCTFQGYHLTLPLTNPLSYFAMLCPVLTSVILLPETSASISTSRVSSPVHDRALRRPVLRSSVLDAGSVRCSETVEKVYGVRPVASALGEQRGKSWAGSF